MILVKVGNGCQFACIAVIVIHDGNIAVRQQRVEGSICHDDYGAFLRFGVLVA